ncbi:MAG: YggS family pyridoxal phosphate-dependent enzyme [Dysgonamonadaceae bacterium]|jgi:pyridoxal phosphate enzyme (YggS family)|nr:YggS family pyridoxal phosphate-dependent enzyme [Dysgonamonadaceae bacterium]
MSIANRLNRIKSEIPANVTLVAVSKFHEPSAIKEAYDAGQRIFGESRVQELVSKYEQLPKDIEWHFIGHLQINKIKHIAPFIDTVHSVDSLKLLNELNQFAVKFQRTINVLIQIHIAQEEHKYGFSYEEAENLFRNNTFDEFPNLQLIGLMGMATFTRDEEQIRKEFAGIADFLKKMKEKYAPPHLFNELSIGMSDDYLIAINEGRSMVRIGSKLFGERTY